MVFEDRFDAGRKLAARLRRYAHRDDVIVLALPRGGVPVGYEVARALAAPLDLFVVRKLGVPGQEELALGAIASGGVRVLNEPVLRSLDISAAEVEEVTALEEKELRRRERLYRGDRPPLAIRDHIAVLVDDGLATGSTMRAAVAALRKHGPGWVVVAVPVGSPGVCADLKKSVDDMVCALEPEHLHAVGAWYSDFTQTTDEEVRDLLAQVNEPLTGPATDEAGSRQTTDDR